MSCGDRLDLPKKNSSCRDLTTWGEWEDGAVGHADIDRTVDGSKGEGSEGRSCGDRSSSKEGFDGTKGGTAIEGETIAVIAGFGDVSDGVSTTSEGAIGTTGGSGGEGGEGVAEAFITFLSGIDRGVSTGRTEKAAGGGIAAVGECRIV